MPLSRLGFQRLAAIGAWLLLGIISLREPGGNAPRKGDATGFAQPSPAGALSPTERQPAAFRSPWRSSNAGPQANLSGPPWAVRFGDEFWRTPGAPAAVGNPHSTPASGVGTAQINHAIERVIHAFQRNPEGDQIQVKSDSYRAIIDGGGLSFESTHPTDTQPQTRASFQTVSMRRGSRRWSLDSVPGSSWSVSGNTAQALLEAEAGLVEHLEALRAGVEVTWLLNRPPAGEDSLVIEASITGPQFSGQTASGLHFKNESGLERLKIGLALAVDSQGKSWPIPLEMAGSTLRATVPTSVLAEAQYPLAIDPLISAEFGVDQPLDSASPCTRAAPVVAANDNGFLVAWSHGKGEMADPAVYAARISQAGVLLDRYGILVSTVAGEQTTCAVAANPDGFLIVWSAPHGSSVTDWDILGARIQPDGSVIDVPPLPICTAAGVQNSPSLAANGSNYLAAWRDSRGTGIYGSLITRGGAIQPTNGFAICVAANDQYMPAVGALGANYLVAWQDYRKATASQYYSDIYAARVTGEGVLMDTNGIAVCAQTNSQYHPSVAANGTHYLVAWEDYEVSGNDIRGARITPDGVVIDTNSLVISQAANAQINPSLTRVGGDFLAVWEDYRDSSTNRFEARTYGARVTGDGAVIDSQGVAFSSGSGQANPAIASSAGTVLAAWEDFRNNPTTTLADIYGAQIHQASQLEVQPDTALTGAVNAQSTPATAANGANYLVVWADNRHQPLTGQDIYGVRLNQAGALLDATAIPICTATNNQAEPAVAASGTNFLVVWSDWRHTPANALHADIYGTLVNLDGTVLYPEGIPITTATNDQSQPAVTGLGPHSLVVWRDARNSTATATKLDIYGARVSLSGDVLDAAGLPICTNKADQSAPAAAGNANQALVVWTDARASASDIYGALVGVEGTVADANGFGICTAAALQSAPAVAANGQDYLVVWADSRNGLTKAPDIYGALVDASGAAQPTNGFPIRVAANAQTAPTVSFNGSQYLVAWQEARPSFTNTFDIRGTTVALDGSITSGFLLAISADGDNAQLPAMAAGADGRFLVANQALYNTGRRVMADFVNPGAMPILDSPAGQTGHPFQFVLRGAIGERYAIEASTNLKAWTQLTVFTNTALSTPFTDSAATNLTLRFYRAVLLP